MTGEPEDPIREKWIQLRKKGRGEKLAVSLNKALG